VLLREAASWAQAQPNIVIFVVNIFGPQDSSSNQERLLKVSTAKKNFIWKMTQHVKLKTLAYWNVQRCFPLKNATA